MGCSEVEIGPLFPLHHDHSVANAPVKNIIPPLHEGYQEGLMEGGNHVTFLPSFNNASMENQVPDGSTQMSPSEYATWCLKLYDIVRRTGKPNYLGARIPLIHGLKIATWWYMLKFTNHERGDYLCDLMEFGFPLGFNDSKHILIPTTRNHPSALAHRDSIRQYIGTETKLLTLVGPFRTTPFQPMMLNPLMSRPKGSQDPDKRRTIVDLSWPLDHGVNHAIDKNWYEGEHCQVVLPTVDHLVQLIVKKGQGSYIFLRDLSRCYRQIKICPLSFPYTGIEFDSQIYFDSGLMFGLKSACHICQEITSAVAHIMIHTGYDLLNYIDDFAGVEVDFAMAEEADLFLAGLLEQLGLDESEKRQSPRTWARWLGIIFDTVLKILQIPDDKIQQTLQMVDQWIHKHSATQRELQSIIGKIMHIAKCVKPARLFLGRMLHTLRAAPERGYIKLDNEFKKDLWWFKKFLPHFNGISMMVLPDLQPKFEVLLDACLTGCGSICGKTYYHTEFPDSILHQQHHISRLELLNIMIACRLFCHQWSKHTVRVGCDNTSAVAILQTGRSKDLFMMACAREIWLLAAMHDFQVIPVHIPGAHMEIPDALSRIHLHQDFAEKCEHIFSDPLGSRLHISDSLFHLNNDS